MAVAMIGLVGFALWLAGLGATGGPSRTGAAGEPSAWAAASPTATPTELAQATLPSAGPTPVVPAVPCNTRTPPPSLIVTLLVGSGRPYAGSTAPSVPPPDVTVAPGASLLLILGAEDCAVAWDIVVTADGMATPFSEDALTNPSLSPAHGMQNRWEVAPLPPGDYLLSAHLSTPNGQAVVGYWRLHVGS